MSDGTGIVWTITEGSSITFAPNQNDGGLIIPGGIMEFKDEDYAPNPNFRKMFKKDVRGKCKLRDGGDTIVIYQFIKMISDFAERDQRS